MTDANPAASPIPHRPASAGRDARPLSDQPNRSLAGLPVLALSIALFLVAAALFATATAIGFFAAVVCALVAIVGVTGLYMLQPNQSAVFTLFGDFRGEDQSAGLRWVNPLYRTRKVSLRIRNFTTMTSKVNDANGNPIEIAAVVVWRVTDTGKAVFGVDNYTDYVHTQSESAVRQLARAYPYDAFEHTDVITLIGDTGEVNEHLLGELLERCDAAGVNILEARITDLSYAPEIAEAMLKRQQASAIVAARAKIVEGAVLMVRDAIEALEQGSSPEDGITFDAERKATFASNLMTVITSDTPTSPVVNVGTLHR